MHLQDLQLSANQISTESNKTEGFAFHEKVKIQNLARFKTQPVALGKIGSNTKKHHLYTRFLAIQSIETLQERLITEDEEIE